MIEITLRTIMKLVPLLGNHRKQTLQINKNSTVQDLLNILEQEYGQELIKILIYEKDLCRGITMYKNGVSILALAGLNTKFEDGDDFLIFPPVGGG